MSIKETIVKVAKIAEVLDLGIAQLIKQDVQYVEKKVDEISSKTVNALRKLDVKIENSVRARQAPKK